MNNGPAFLLQIVYPDGTVLRFPAGDPLNDPCEGEGRCVECFIIDEICKRGVGFLRSEAHVRRAVAEAFMALKEKTHAFAPLP